MVGSLACAAEEAILLSLVSLLSCGCVAAAVAVHVSVDVATATCATQGEPMRLEPNNGSGSQQPAARSQQPHSTRAPHITPQK